MTEDLFVRAKAGFSPAYAGALPVGRWRSRDSAAFRKPNGFARRDEPQARFKFDVTPGFGRVRIKRANALSAVRRVDDALEFARGGVTVRFRAAPFDGRTGGIPAVAPWHLFMMKSR